MGRAKGQTNAVASAGGRFASAGLANRQHTNENIGKEIDAWVSGLDDDTRNEFLASKDATWLKNGLKPAKGPTMALEHPEQTWARVKKRYGVDGNENANENTAATEKPDADHLRTSSGYGDGIPWGGPSGPAPSTAGARAWPSAAQPASGTDPMFGDVSRDRQVTQPSNAAADPGFFAATQSGHNAR